MLELGLRFRPQTTNEASLNSYNQQVALLTQDCADIPPKLLAQAIERYVKIPGSNFLPRASQLLEIAKAIANPPSAGPVDLEEHCAKINAMKWVKAYKREYFVNQEKDDQGNATGPKYVDWRAHDWSQDDRPTPNRDILSPAEIEKLMNSPHDSAARAFFNMGKNAGFIVFVDGRWIDSQSTAVKQPSLLEEDDHVAF